MKKWESWTPNGDIMRIKWLRTARKNLDAATSCIAGEDPEAAQKAYAHIKKSVEALGEHPEMGRPGRIFGTKELVISGYPFIVPYRIKGKEVHILRVFHTSQRLPEQW